MNFYKLFLGLIIIIAAIIFIKFELDKNYHTKKNDHMSNYYLIKTIGAIVLFIIVGLVMIYRELKYFL